HAKSLETPASRLRSKLLLPIPPRRGTQSFSYRLDLRRDQVDALDFIDAVQPDALTVDEVRRLLALWRGDPRVLSGSLPASEWQALNRAIERFCDHVNALGSQAARQIRAALDTFQEIVPEAASAVRSQAPVAAAPRRRLLIVENEQNVAERLGAIL